MALSLDIVGNIDRVRERIERACDRAGRDPGSVELVFLSLTGSGSAPKTSKTFTGTSFPFT